MANMILPEWQVYLMIVVMVMIPLLTGLIVLSIFKAIPWAWTMYKAFRANTPIVWKHHPRGASEICEAKIEKDLKEGVPVTYYKVDKWGFKVSDIAGENTELLMGKLRIIHYFKNNVSPVNLMDSVAIDQLFKWLQKKGINVTNREDAMLFILSEHGRTGKLIEALESSKIEDEETKRTIIDAIKTIKENEDELRNLKLSDGVFIFQTAMTAIDRSISFTSSAFANAKSAIEAQLRAKMAEDKNKELYRTVLIIAVLLICAAIAYAIISKSGVI